MSSMFGMDQRDTTVKSSQRGGEAILTQTALSKRIRYVYPKLGGEPIIFRPLTSVDEAGKLQPFRYADPNAEIHFAAQDQYFLRGLQKLNMVEWLGPQLTKEEKESKAGFFSSFIDYHHETGGENTCLQQLIAAAPKVLAMNRKYAGEDFYTGDPYTSALKPSSTVWMLPIMCFQHENEKWECSSTDPKPGVIKLTKTAVESLREIMFREHSDYSFPEGNLLDALNNRAEQNKRFICADVCDEERGPVFSVRGVKKSHANYFQVELTAAAYGNDIGFNSEYWLEPDSIFRVMKFEETFNFIRGNAANQLWLEFLEDCAREIPKLADMVPPKKEEQEDRGARVPAAPPAAPKRNNETFVEEEEASAEKPRFSGFQAASAGAESSMMPEVTPNGSEAPSDHPKTLGDTTQNMLKHLDSMTNDL